MYTIDFETRAIESGSRTMPEAVGVAIQHNGKKPKYYSWGHLNLDDTLQDANEHSYEDAFKVLFNILNSGEPLLFHNAKFDYRILKEWFSWPDIEPTRIHDSLFLMYLRDPREESLSLKDLTDKYCELPPEEQDELYNWIIENIKKATPKTAGAYICYGPVPLVKKYALSDVDRTYKLWKQFKKEVLAA